jgi:hypothetical protein
MDAYQQGLVVEPTHAGSASGAPTALGATDWLCLAAAPTFAVMALLTAVFESGGLGLLCAGGGAWPLGGMVPMYLLMTAFHLAPWLRLISGGQSRSVGPDPAPAPRQPPAPRSHQT